MRAIMTEHGVYDAFELRAELINYKKALYNLYQEAMSVKLPGTNHKLPGTNHRVHACTPPMAACASPARYLRLLMRAYAT